MAAPTKTVDETLMSHPFTIKKFTFTAGNTATAFAHGGPGTPDLAFATRAATNPTASETAVYSLTATQFTVDCEATSGAVDVVLMWFQGAAQDGESISEDTDD